MYTYTNKHFLLIVDIHLRILNVGQVFTSHRDVNPTRRNTLRLFYLTGNPRFDRIDDRVLNVLKQLVLAEAIALVELHAQLADARLIAGARDAERLILVRAKKHTRQIYRVAYGAVKPLSIGLLTKLFYMEDH